MQTNGDPAINFFAYEYTLKGNTPAVYCIRCFGDLEESWSERLGGLRIISSAPGNRRTITTLLGPLPNQAALFGVLGMLYDLNRPLLSVVRLEGT